MPGEGKHKSQQKDVCSYENYRNPTAREDQEVLHKAGPHKDTHPNASRPDAGKLEKLCRNGSGSDHKTSLRLQRRADELPTDVEIPAHC